MKRIRAVDLFCGAGGSSWGAQRAGAEVIAGFDRWELASRTWQANFPDGRAWQTSLEDTDPRRLARGLGRVDLLLASPECTNHTHAKGAAARCERSKETAFQVTRFADALRPRWIIIENVVGMRRWHRYAEFLQQLEDLGYQHEVVTLDASAVGVPQSRRRLFIVCDRERAPQIRPPAKGETRPASRAVDLDAPFSWSMLRTPRRAQGTLERAARAIAELGHNEPFLLVYYGTDQAGGWQRLDAPLRTVTTLDRFAVVRPTRFGHEMRMLQVPELKRAMGMPAKFQTPHGTRRDRIMLLGNGVCPPVMTHLVRGLTRSR